ncbi:hypothetical protein Tco_0654337 [Tanacetum coccineum]|uniref:No apical meristem-associated C-terminal domain-containing protein n=1 Tax=Tanacetum coccineum TaxID=301880 RepID=A0ABQ4X3B4_9ASTR
MVEQVETSPTKNKKKVTRNRQKRTSQSVDALRQTPWTTEQEIVLPKGWLAFSENSKDGNAKKQVGFWCEESRAGDEYYVQKSGGSKRHKTSGFSSFNTESGEASINLNTNVGDNDEDEVQEIRRPEGRDKARALEKEERLAFLEIKMKEVECREREIKQQDMKFYLKPYDHLTGTSETQWMK